MAWKTTKGAAREGGIGKSEGAIVRSLYSRASVRAANLFNMGVMRKKVQVNKLRRVQFGGGRAGSGGIKRERRCAAWIVNTAQALRSVHADEAGGRHPSRFDTARVPASGHVTSAPCLTSPPQNAHTSPVTAQHFVTSQKYDPPSPGFPDHPLVTPPTIDSLVSSNHLTLFSHHAAVNVTLPRRISHTYIRL